MCRMRLLILSGLSICAVCAAAEHTVTRSDVEKWMTELSNWGRWGKEDQIGTVNLITAAKRKEAAALVKEGVAISLSHDYLEEKAPDNGNPFIHKMLSTGDHPSGDWFMDEYSVVFHGLAHTHMDSLAHTSWKGKMYNGFPISVVTGSGAGKLAVTGFRNGIFTRGVLIDIPKLKGVPYLEPGTAI